MQYSKYNFTNDKITLDDVEGQVEEGEVGHKCQRWKRRGADGESRWRRWWGELLAEEVGEEWGKVKEEIYVKMSLNISLHKKLAKNVIFKERLLPQKK